jgi:MFS family permease
MAGIPKGTTFLAVSHSLETRLESAVNHILAGLSFGNIPICQKQQLKRRTRMEPDTEQGMAPGPEPGDSLTRAEWMLLLVLAAVQFTHSMDFMVMIPLGPQCREELRINPREFATVVSSYGFSAALAGLLAAFFIDRFDRKKTLLVLYAGLITGTFLCAIAPGYWSLMLARIVAGAFGGVGGAFILVIIGDAFPEIRRGRATGVVMTAFSIASIAGMPVGILLGNHFGIRTPFGVLGLFGLATWGLAFKVLPPMRGHLQLGLPSPPASGGERTGVRGASVSKTIGVITEVFCRFMVHLKKGSANRFSC